MQLQESAAQNYFALFGIPVLFVGFRASSGGTPRITVKDCNPVFLRFFQLRKEEIVSHPVSSLLEEQSYNQSLMHLYMGMQLGRHGTVILSLRDGDGHPRETEISYFKVSEASACEDTEESLWCWVLRPSRRQFASSSASSLPDLSSAAKSS